MREIFIDIIKTLSTLMVIVSHTIINRELFLKIGGPFFLDCAVPLFLIITGYNYSKSLIRKNILCIKDYFQKQYIIMKIKRIVIPSSIVIILEVFFYYFSTTRVLSIQF